ASKTPSRTNPAKGTKAKAAGLGAGTGLAAAFALVPLAGLVRDGVFDAVRVAPEGVAFAMTRAVY
ncbi:MAG: hypothetical protein EBU70_15730, partial [Actinobacteria bacterium]|nr:hypothetical protein [Actinomycetota bacterium]